MNWKWIKRLGKLCGVAVMVLMMSGSCLLPGAAQAEERLSSSGASENEMLISLEVADVEIVDVLKIIAKRAGLNIVAGKDVQGKVSIFLNEVPVREGLKTILQSQQLAYYEEDGILKVVTDTEFQSRFGRPFGDSRVTRVYSLQFAEAGELAATLGMMKSPSGRVVVDSRSNRVIVSDYEDVMRELDDLVWQIDRPLTTEAIKVKYAKAADILAGLKEVVQGEDGSIVADEQSNKIIVKGTPAKIEAIRRLVESLDLRRQQIFIQAKVVEVRLNDAHRQGIDWQAVAKDVSASLPLTVSAPTGASLSTISFMGGDLTAVVQAIERVGKTNTLSSPRITVLDNQEAKLSVATRQPYVSQTVTQTDSSTNTADNVQFVDVGVSLNVMPRVLSPDLVEMRIKPQVSSSTSSLELQSVADASNTVFTRTKIPIVTTQELETIVTAQSGTTIIIGGLIQDAQDRQFNRVPIIGELPLVGQLFNSVSDDFVKTELVVFLTPTIVNENSMRDFNHEFEQFFGEAGEFKLSDRGGSRSAPDFGTRNTILEPRRMPYWTETVSSGAEQQGKVATVQSGSVPA